MAVAALQGLLEMMHTTLGQAGLLGNASHALCSIVTKTLENSQPVLWIAQSCRLIYGSPCYTNGGGESGDPVAYGQKAAGRVKRWQLTVAKRLYCSESPEVPIK